MVGPDDGGVQDQPLQVGVLQGREGALPDPLLGPAAEALPDVVPGAEALGQVAPGGAGLGDLQHRIDKEAVIPCGDAGIPRLAGEQILDPLPSLVREGMAVPHDRVLRDR